MSVLDHNDVAASIVGKLWNTAKFDNFNRKGVQLHVVVVLQ